MNKFTDLIQTTLAESPQYYDEIVALVEGEFNYTQEHSFGEDFHLLMNRNNFENSHFLIDKKSNRVVSHIAYCKREMIKDNLVIPVVFIGAIATDSNFRGRGLFKNLMNTVLKKNENNTALFILWSEIAGLYEKFNFHLAGALQETGKVDFILNTPPAGFSKCKFNELSPKEFQEVINLYQLNNESIFFTVKRTPLHWSMIKNISSIDLFINKDQSGNIQQYFCINKGRDLTNIIHEISAAPESLEKLLNIIGQYKCWLPAGLIESENQNELFYTAFIRLGEVDKLNAFLAPLSKGELKIIKIDEKIKFNYKDESYETSQSEFIQYLFGPNMLDEFKSLGLSPYISGTDSV